MFVHHLGNALLYISCSLNEPLALSVSEIMYTTDKIAKVSLYRKCRLSACYGIVQYEPRHEKTGFLQTRKQRRRSASR